MSGRDAGAKQDTVEPGKQLSKESAPTTTTSSFLAELRTGEAAAALGAASGGKRRVSTSAVIVPVVLITCAGLLWGMRKLGVAAIVQFDEIKIDYTPQGSAKANTHQRLLAELERSGTPLQVPTEQVKKNPFKMSVKKEALVDTTDNSEEDQKRQIEAHAKALAERQKKITDALGMLALQGVLGGTVPVARVSGETVRVGDTLAEVFNVTAITGRSVTLEADGKEYTLNMQEPKQNNTKSTKKR